MSRIGLIIRLLLTFCGLWGLESMACLNGFGENLRESAAASEHKFPVPFGHPVNTKDADVLDAMRESKREYEGGSYKMGIDYSLFLIYDRQYEEAERVCRDLVKRFPNKYEAVVNLGTILEVNGKNEEALSHIRKAIALNPGSHHGSEWIHERILEAKVKGGMVPSGAELLGHDFGMEGVPKTSMGKAELKQLQEQLFYQLNERVTFIGPKDGFIANLMFELANVSWLVGDLDAVMKLYKRAATYGYKDALLAERRRAFVAGRAVPVVDTGVVGAGDSVVGEPEVTDSLIRMAMTVDSAPQVVAVAGDKKDVLGEEGDNWLLYLAIGALVLASAGLVLRRMRSRGAGTRP